MARTGRPLKGDAKRDQRLEIRLTAKEKAIILETAKQNNLSSADLIIQAVKKFGK